MEGTAQNQSLAKEKVMSVVTKHKLLLIRARIEIYLPEPGSLQESEGAAQQLQKDVTSVEDLQEGNKSASEDGVEKELMYVDVQHTPAMEVVEEKKSCRTETRLTIGKIDEKSDTNGILTAFLFFMQE